MAPFVRSSIAKASPATIWSSCFEDMKWEKWDPDLTGLGDVSGGCENGTSFKFEMKKGQPPFPMVLENVAKNVSLTFKGGRGCIIKCIGTIVLKPVQANSTQIEYSFKMSGLMGGLLSSLKKEEIIGGMEQGLANMVSLSEKEAEYAL